MRLTKHHTSSPEAYQVPPERRGHVQFCWLRVGECDRKRRRWDQAARTSRRDRPELRARARAARMGAMWLASINADDVAFARAREALARADALDPNLAESHVAGTCSS